MSNRFVTWAACLLLVGCSDSHDQPCEPLEVGWTVVTDGNDDLDLLFVIDNSGTMTEEQASLGQALPGLLTALLTGDTDADGEPDIEPVHSLHVGVVSTDMGTGGHVVPTCARAAFGDDGVLRTEGLTALAGCPAEVPSFMTFSPDDEPDAAAADLACVTNVGNGGCGFEQQMEAMLKALSPSAPSDATPSGYVAPRFEAGTSGHSDGANAGFLRRDSTLVVITLTDEEDCSAADSTLFDPDSPAYSGTDLNLRCFQHPEALHPVERYVEGLLSLRAAAGQLVFVPMVGIPVELATEPNGRTDWDALIGPPDVRDPRMVARVDPAMPTRLVPSCNVPGRGQAFPPIRMVQTAHQLSLRGARVSVQSICQESFAAVVHAVAAQRRSPLVGDCLGTTLERGVDGRVDCTIAVTLPDTETCAAVAGATARTNMDGTPETDEGRARCDITQIPVDAAARLSGAPPPGDGFWVDDYLGPFACSGAPSRVALPALPAYTTVSLRCPVTALGDETLGDPCDPAATSFCPPAGGQPRVCDPVTERCSQACAFDADCSRFTDTTCAIEEGATEGVCRPTSC